MVGWILLGLAGLILLLLFCPLGVEVRYRNGAMGVRLRLLGIWKRLLPARQKPPKKERKKRGAPEPPEKKPVQKKTPMPLMDILQGVNDLLPEIGGALGTILRHVTVWRLRGRYTVQGEDAAETGIRYGQMSTLCYNSYVLLAAQVRLKEWKVALIPDFTQTPPPPPELELYLTVSPAILLYGGLRLLTSGLVTLSQVKQQGKTTRNKNKRR